MDQENIVCSLNEETVEIFSDFIALPNNLKSDKLARYIGLHIQQSTSQ
jgi:hypothetical protein